MTNKQYRYRERKSLNLCVNCGNQDDYTISGRALCFECNEESKVHSKKYYAENKEKIKIAKHKDRQILIKRGICISCRKRNAAKGRQRCKECLAKALEATRRCQQKKRLEEIEGVK